MANYTGARCPVCEKKFTDNDDIVVCPICGAPHHRSCYQQLGHCALDELHIKGHTWQPSQEDSQQEQQGGTSCPCCGANNPASGIFCQICGAPIKGPSACTHRPADGWQDLRAAASAAYNSAFGGLSPEEEIEGVSARDIALYIGSNSRYFLPRFKQLSLRGGVSPNLAAFFFNFLYFFYRKMYLVGGLLLGLFLLAQLPTLVALPEYMVYVYENIEIILKGINPAPFTPTQYIWAYSAIKIARIILFASGFTMSLFGNRVYMSHVLNRIRRIRAACTAPDGAFDDTHYTETLARRGKTSRLAVILCAVGVFLVIYIACEVVAAIVYNQTI
ncbi:MAG: hypothetical protein HFG20_08570 [Anaerotruncus sp.]|nr:hypothetical protein [Anaerotruncus sp.]